MIALGLSTACAGSDVTSPAPDAMPATERDGGAPDGGFVDPCEGTWDWSTDFGIDEVGLGYLARVRSIRGDLELEDITLPADAARCLEVVHGSVRLEDVVLGPGAFSELVAVEGDFEIYAHVDHGTADRFEALESIGGMLRGNRPLEVESLVEVGGDLIHGRLDPPALRRVGGDVDLYGPLVAPTLETVEGHVTWYDDGSLQASGLAVVGGYLDLTLADTTVLEFGALREAGGIALGPNRTLTDLAFPSLETVTASIAITGSPAIERIDLSALRSVGALLVQDNDLVPELAIDGLAFAGIVSLRRVQARSLHFDRLERVGKDFALSDIQGLSRLDLSALAGVGGLFGITACPELARVEAERLAYVGEVVIYRMAGLAEIALPALTAAPMGVTLLFNPWLEDFSASIEGEMDRLHLVANPRLVGLGGVTRVTALGGLAIEDRGALGVVALPVATSIESINVRAPVELSLPRVETVDTLILARAVSPRIELPALRSVRFAQVQSTTGFEVWETPRLEQIDVVLVTNNRDLVTFDAPALTRIRSLQMSANPLLPTCAVDDLVARLSVPPETQRVGGNGPCPGG